MMLFLEEKIDSCYHSIRTQKLVSLLSSYVECALLYENMKIWKFYIYANFGLKTLIFWSGESRVPFIMYKSGIIHMYPPKSLLIACFVWFGWYNKFGWVCRYRILVLFSLKELSVKKTEYTVNEQKYNISSAVFFFLLHWWAYIAYLDISLDG